MQLTSTDIYVYDFTQPIFYVLYQCGRYIILQGYPRGIGDGLDVFE